MAASRAGIVTITGPDLDLQTRDGVGAATSRALTAAQRYVRAEGERPASFYVRGESGDALARVDVEADGSTFVWRLDRGARYADPASLTRRPEPPATEKEEGMATQRKARTSRSSSRSSAKNDSARKTTAAAKAPTARRSAEAAMSRVSAKDATSAALKAAEGPMSVADIAEKVLATDGVSLGGKTPAATIAAILSVENKKPDGLFVRVEKGKYTLRETTTA